MFAECNLVCGILVLCEYQSFHSLRFSSTAGVDDRGKAVSGSSETDQMVLFETIIRGTDNLVQRN
jgi:hypothetical protein